MGESTSRRPRSRWRRTTLGIAAAVHVLAAGACSLRSLAYLTDGPADSGADGTSAGLDAGSCPVPVPADAALCNAAIDTTQGATCGDAFVFPPNDPNNCGRCGHSCLGGICTMGVCQPAVIYAVPPDSGAYGFGGGTSVVTVMNGRVYWSTLIDPADSYMVSRAAVGSIAVDGGGAATSAILPFNTVSFAIDPYGAHAIYFVQDTYDPYAQTLQVHPLTGASDDAGVALGYLPDASNVSGADFAFDESTVYVVDHQSSLYELKRDAGSLPAVTINTTDLGAHQGPPYFVVAMPPYIAWINAPWIADWPNGKPPPPDAGPASWIVVFDPAAGASALQYFGPYMEPTNLTADPASGALYWFDAFTEKLMSLRLCDRDAGPTVVGTWSDEEVVGDAAQSGQQYNRVNGILPSSPSIYVGMQHLGQLEGIASFGCGKSPTPGNLTVSIWPIGGNSYSGVAQDNMALYWGQDNPSLIHRIAK
jgi:hypothetical protein